MATNFFRIPRAFYDDHFERELPTPKAIWGIPMYPPKGGYIIAADDPALPELINDAQYYAHADGPDEAPPGLKRAAKALLAALGRPT